MSALKIGDEITVINNERTKTFDQDDIQYSISQAVLSGHLILKVRRYDNGKEGMIMSSVIVLVLKARISQCVIGFGMHGPQNFHRSFTQWIRPTCAF